MPTKLPHEEEQRQLNQLEYEIQYHETMENPTELPELSSNEIPKLPKKRGPKKKQMTPSRLARIKVRRIKANGRERERMKDLNENLERLRQTIPFFSFSQKLSKIETLRLAKNYIQALSSMISTNTILDNQQFAQLLCKDLSLNTINLVAATLSINPQVLQDHNQPNINENENYILSSNYPKVNNPLEFINLKKITSESEDYGSSYGGDSSMDEINPIAQSYSTNFYSHEQQQLMDTDNSFYYYHPHSVPY